jgi:hypothetical protein
VRTTLVCSALLWGIATSPLAAGQEKPGDLPERAKGFIELLVKEDFAGAARHFDATVLKALPAEKLQQFWKQMGAQVGPLQKQVAVRTEKAGPHDAVVITCQFEKALLDVLLVFDNTKQISGFRILPAKSKEEAKPPAYANPNAFRETEVEFGSGDWVLPGTLTRPVGKGLFPVVVLLHGSGPHDRDETLGPNKVFRDLAWGLGSRGIAVLRFEKRTKHYGWKMTSPKDMPTIQDEVIDDALAAVALLKKTDGIDRKRIYVLGHSLGAHVAPKVGSQDAQVAGLICLAGNSRPLEDLIPEQFSYLFSLDGKIDDEERKQLDKLKQQVARLKDPALTADVPAEELPLNLPARYWLSLRGYRPAEEAKSLKQPMLILQGERDYQISMEDFQGWKNALSGRKNVTFKSYPQLNHLFMAGEGKSKPAEYMRPGNVALLVVDDIANWIRRK